MKRILSFIITASILFQTVIPGLSMMTYAQTESLYSLRWESGKRLSGDLKEGKGQTGREEALVSWQVGSERGFYTLTYFIEDETATGTAEKVEVIFEPVDIGKTARVHILKDGETAYQTFDNDTNTWIDIGKDETILVEKNSTYPGGRMRVGDKIEVRLKWDTDDTVYVQTNAVKSGNITPFELKHSSQNIGGLDKVEVLTGIKDYKMSPTHIQVKDGEITEKKTIIMPGADHPGSEPGIRLEFKQPQHLDPSKSKFISLNEEEAKKIHAKLDIADLTGISGQLTFNLSKNALITGLDNENKKLLSDDATKKHTLYLAKNDYDHPHIIKWDALEHSLIFEKINLSISRDLGLASRQPLGIFPLTDKNETSDKKGDIGRYSYLNFKIKRSGLKEANIEMLPYKGTVNTELRYIVEVSSDGTNWGDGQGVVEHKYTPDGTDDQDPITIPVPLTAIDSDQYYRIKVGYSQGVMYSQTLHYKPKEEGAIPAPVPFIDSISNIYAVPPINLGEQPTTIGFDLTWSAPPNTSSNIAKDKVLDTLLKTGDLYYELFLHDNPEAQQGVLIKTFKVTAQDDEILVKPYAGTAGNQDAQGDDLSAMRYHPGSDTFTMENVVLKKPTEDGWEQISKMPTDYHETRARYPDLDEITIDNNLKDKTAPGIYYLTMRSVYESKITTDGGALGVSHTSNPKSITISPLEETIPVPTKIESKNDKTDVNTIKQSFSWGNIDLSRYITQMLDPLNLSLDARNQRTYEIYLYQDKEMDQSKLDKTTPAAINLDTKKTYQLKDQDIRNLRAGKALRLDYTGISSKGMSTINFQGLDANQVYYAVIRVRLNIQDQDGNPEKPRESIFSKEHTFTSYVKPSEPGPGERVPPVPKNLRIIEQLSNTTVKIGWEAPEEGIQEDDSLAYEIIRYPRQLTEDSRLLSIKDLLKKDETKEMKTWRTSDLRLEDDTLRPNNIYYYYVRTVLEVEGTDVYSSWVGLPVTTEPVKKPIQLKIENPSAYDHSPKWEIVVSFLAPVPKGANVPSEYNFDIAVQGEDDEDYRLDYPAIELKSELEDKDIPTGYRHFVYKIQDVKPGKRYDVKVRVIDKEAGGVSGQEDKSLYSDRVSTRTHFDQEEQDKDDRFKEYMKYFEDKVEALRRKPYWTLDEGKDTFSAKYRSNYVMPEMGKKYQLASKEEMLDLHYYMPASLISNANLQQMSFDIDHDQVTYSVRPSTITSDLEELRMLLEDIKDQDIKDYYVKFLFRQIPQTLVSRGEGALTPKIILDISLIKLRDEDRLIEDRIMIDLNKRINWEKRRFIDELEKQIKKGKISKDDLDIIVDDSIEAIEKEHQRDVKSIIKSNTRKTMGIETWNKKMLIMAKIDGHAAAQGYLLSDVETALPTFTVAGGYGVEADHRGTYIFKGQRIAIPAIPGVRGANDLVAKYQLTDFFGSQGQINPNTMAIKKDVLGAMARVLGAQRGADYTQYLKQMNIQGVNNIGIHLPMKKGEGIYLLMQAYEKNIKKPIHSVHVKNRNIVPNIRLFNPAHQPYVLVAADSKKISLGSGINPNDTMLIKDVFEMLTNISTGLR